MSTNYPQQYGNPYVGERKTNTMAIVSLISSFFVSLLGVIFGHIALGQIKRTGEGGRGLAIAGLVIGYVGLVAGVIILIATFATIGATTGV